MSKFPRGVETVAGMVIENDEGKILMTLSPKWGGKWAMPGGHIEPGETIMETAVREGEEETGLKLEAVSVFYWGEFIDDKEFHRPAHFIFFDVHCRATGGELKLDGKELSECQWLAPEEALHLDLAKSYRETLESFIKYRSKL